MGHCGVLSARQDLNFPEPTCVFFFGQHQHVIDAKQRLAIPAAIRDVLSKEVHGSVFWASPGPNGQLWLWPEKTFERYAANLEGSLLPQQESMEYEQMLFAQSQRCPVDAAGRVRLRTGSTTPADRCVRSSTARTRCCSPSFLTTQSR